MNEAWVFGIVAEGLAHFTNGGVNAVFRVDEDLAAPETTCDLFAGDDLAFAGGEEDEKLHGLALHLERSAATAQFEAVAIEPEVTEFKDRPGHQSYPRGGSIAAAILR